MRLIYTGKWCIHLSMPNPSCPRCKRSHGPQFAQTPDGCISLLLSVLAHREDTLTLAYDALGQNEHSAARDLIRRRFHGVNIRTKVRPVEGKYDPLLAWATKGLSGKVLSETSLLHALSPKGRPKASWPKGLQPALSSFRKLRPKTREEAVSLYMERVRCLVFTCARCAMPVEAVLVRPTASVRAEMRKEKCPACYLDHLVWEEGVVSYGGEEPGTSRLLGSGRA